MNPVAAALTGWTEEEARGRPLADVFDILSEDTRLAVESPAAKVKRIGNIVGPANHTVLIAKDGTEVHIDDSAAPIRDDDGELTGIVLVFRNIDERREAERQRDAVIKQLEEVMRLTTDSIVSVNRDWIMAYMNPKALEGYGSDRQLIGRDVWEAFPGAVYEGSPYVEHCYRAMNEGIPGGFDAHYPEPLNLWLHIAVYPAPEGIVTFSRDITDETLARGRRPRVGVGRQSASCVGRVKFSRSQSVSHWMQGSHLFCHWHLRKKRRSGSGRDLKLLKPTPIKP